MLNSWSLDDVDRVWIDELEKRNPYLYLVIVAIGKVGGKSNMSYMIYMAVRMLEIHRLLKSTGSIYLHCDPTMSHSLKLMMDAIFGKKNFCNEIVWRRGHIVKHGSKKAWLKNHDCILFYFKEQKYRKNFYELEYRDYADSTMKMYKYDDEDGSTACKNYVPMGMIQ